MVPSAGFVLKNAEFEKKTTFLIKHERILLFVEAYGTTSYEKW